MSGCYVSTDYHFFVTMRGPESDVLQDSLLMLKSRSNLCHKTWPKSNQLPREHRHLMYVDWRGKEVSVTYVCNSKRGFTQRFKEIKLY